jgi:carbonic anhydrase
MAGRIPVSFRHAALVACPLLAVGCAGHGDLSNHHYFHEAERPHAAEWGYAGDIGPEHWGDLSPDYALAKTGTSQSPIDIDVTAASDLPPIRFDYHPATIDLVYNGHTVEEKEDKHSSIEVGGVRYTLEQFHFHAPSEHTIGGRHADMEMHLVHKSGAGAVAVVAVMIRAGAENPAFAPVWGNLPTAENKSRQSSTTVDVGKLLPSNTSSYYRYAGSFTTPPCTEGVLWMVLHEPVELSASQIAAFRDVIHGNNRPVQALRGRTVEQSR